MINRTSSAENQLTFTCKDVKCQIHSTLCAHILKKKMKKLEQGKRLSVQNDSSSDTKCYQAVNKLIRE